ncbi:Uncharacterized protein PKNOH_S130198700 [Plasmodium knowlesi]|uniref:Eukaryotic translation initiation factor 3 30 kDa subunit n=1 Tax=Plasmodium knowlesi TaxID=5850 RepID=A0A1Y3DMG5_PLAKN|nr:Uncharacterized protein PKNOH_S130198700 [Plasmodium knowlesi]
MDKSNSEVDDWTEWLNDEEEKREDFNLDSTGKDEALKKKILQNNDCETLGEILASRIQESKAKSVAIERLLSIILPACEGKLEDKELQSINRKIQELIEKREKKKRYALINKKKPNEVKNALKNYKDEVDMIYGDLSYDEEDYENEDAEEFAEEY